MKLFQGNKNNLDEMQEQKLLKLESRGFWLIWWALLAAMAVQLLVCGAEAQRHLLGEWAVFMVASVYMVAACIRQGLWDRKLKPNLRTNLLLSLLTGVAMAVFGLFAFDYWNWVSALLTGVVTALLVFGGLQLGVWVVSLRRKELDKEEKQ